MWVGEYRTDGEVGKSIVTDTVPIQLILATGSSVGNVCESRARGVVDVLSLGEKGVAQTEASRDTPRLNKR